MTLVSAIAMPLLVAALVWWISTGAILWLDRRPRATYAWSFGAATIVAIAALGGLVASADEANVAGAYLAFACAIALWGWHEMSFLMGFIVGPRRTPCPAGARGMRRFNLAAATLMHHEVALAATAAALVALTWGKPNQIGALVFLVLWILRLSAKFNLFLGAPFRAEELLPPHLAHLKTYFRHRRMNALFPFSMAFGLMAAAALAAWALSPARAAHEQAGGALVFALLALGLLEHIFLFVRPPAVLYFGMADKTAQPTPTPNQPAP